MSHEILNPLAGIKAAVEILRETEKLSPQGRETVAEIDGEIEQISHVLRQFMEFTFCPQPSLIEIPLEALLQSLRDSFSERFPDFQIEISVARKLTVRADLAMSQRVLSELLRNCIRQGARRAMTSGRATKGTVTVTVRNDGPRIAPEIAHRVFEPFFSTWPRSAGLGLSIARRWLAAMDCVIRLLPDRDGFEIRLPRGK